MSTDSGIMRNLPVRNVLFLLAGRSSYRIAILVSHLILYQTWSPTIFGDYWSRIGSLLAVIPFLASGIEKSALNLIGRANRLRWLLTTAFVHVILVLSALSMFVSIIVPPFFSTSNVKLTILTSLLVTLLGTHQSLVAVARVNARESLDYQTFGILSVALVALTLCTHVLGWKPLTFCILHLSVVSLLIIAVFTSLKRDFTKITLQTRAFFIYSQIARTAFYMGLNSIIDAIPFSMCFLLLRLYSLPYEAARLAVAHAFLAIILGFFQYVLRIYQPTVSRLLHKGVFISSYRFIVLVISGLLFVVLTYTGIVVYISLLVTDKHGQYLSVLLAAMAGVPLIMLTEMTTYLLENFSRRTLIYATLCIAGGCSVSLCSACVLVPISGSRGALVAIYAGEVANLALSVPLIFVLSRRV